MKISDFPLILPALTGKDLVTSGMEELNEAEPQSDQAFTLEYLSLVLAEIGSIPDGMHLLEFPSHYEGANCWCRPKVIATDAMLLINHKDLRRGEFDS
jgi:hypothetical protein